MSTSYRIEIDPLRSLVRLTLIGFIDRETVTTFAAERITAMKKLRCGPNQHVTLCDISCQHVSPPDVAEYFRQMIADPRYSARRLAFVMDSALGRFQTQRIVQRDRVGYFKDVESAEAWLTDDTPVGVEAEQATA